MEIEDESTDNENMKATWKNYLVVAIVFAICWIPLSIPSLEQLSTMNPELLLFLPIPFLASYIYGIKFGRQMLTGITTICLITFLIFCLIELRTLTQYITLTSALVYFTKAAILLTLIVLILILNGAYVGKLGLSIKSIAVVILTATISVFLLNGFDNAFASYGINSYTLNTLVLILVVFLLLVLTAIITIRFTKNPME